MDPKEPLKCVYPVDNKRANKTWPWHNLFIRLFSFDRLIGEYAVPYLSAVQHEIVNIEKVRRKHGGILAIAGRFCSHPLYIHYPTKGYDPNFL